jgi:hypothetical protein
VWRWLSIVFNVNCIYIICDESWAAVQYNSYMHDKVHVHVHVYTPVPLVRFTQV